MTTTFSRVSVVFFFSWAMHSREITYVVIHYVFSYNLPLANIKHIFIEHLIGMKKAI